MSPYFSVKAVAGMEGLIGGKAEQLDRILNVASEGSAATVMNLSDIFFAFSNDVVRSFSFGSDNSLLSDLEESKKQRENLAKLLTGVPVNKHFPWIANGLAKIMPLVLGQKAIPPAVMEMIQFRANIGKQIQAVFDEKSDTKPDHSIFYDLRDSETLPPEEKTVPRLQDEATLLIIAGTESPAMSLTIATFYLLHHPNLMAKLRHELADARQSAATEDLSLGILLSLPYINAICQEANRLSFGVTRRLVRYSPTETLTYTASSGPYKGTAYVLPPGTLMCSSSLCVHTDEVRTPW